MDDGIALNVKIKLVESRLQLVRNTIWDAAVELRVMERVKDDAACKIVKDNLVRCEKMLDELVKIRQELEAENGVSDAAK